MEDGSKSEDGASDVQLLVLKVSQECVLLLETGKGENTDSLLRASGRNQPTLLSAQ